jgi:hypothetical protein
MQLLGAAGHVTGFVSSARTVPVSIVGAFVAGAGGGSFEQPASTNRNNAKQ